jgi:hypothetical protein
VAAGCLTPKIILRVIQQGRAVTHGIKQKMSAGDTQPARGDAGGNGTFTEQAISRRT